eukprot:11228335-Lingulodinium_polyedra.AAC.2
MHFSADQIVGFNTTWSEKSWESDMSNCSVAIPKLDAVAAAAAAGPPQRARRHARSRAMPTAATLKAPITLLMHSGTPHHSTLNATTSYTTAAGNANAANTF